MGRVAQEGDLAHLDLAVLLDLEGDPHLVRVALDGDGLAAHLGQEEAFFGVELADLVLVGLDAADVQDREGLDVHDLADLLGVELVVALVADALDRGLLLDHEGQDELAVDLARVHLDVLEEAQRVDGAQVAADLVKAQRLAFALADVAQDRLGLDAAVALDQDVVHGAARLPQRRAGPQQQPQRAERRQ
jgi:hypothetical protein